jgi:unsaturated rhamnogalacturonyl hydrolase
MNAVPRSLVPLVACALTVGCAPPDGTDTDGVASTGDSTGDGSTGGSTGEYFDDCGAGPPDAACYASKRDPGSESVALAQAIARRHMRTHPATEQIWDWEETVFMFGLTELYRVTGEQEFHDHYAAWIDHHIESGYVMENSDTCAPAAVAAILYIETGDDKYREVVEDGLDYLHDVALRGEHGGISHFGALKLFGVTLWVDSLFMFGNVMTRWGEHTGDGELLAEYGEQVRIFGELLQTDDGLYVHADRWFGLDPTIHWGRGNGWASAAITDYLRVRTLRGETDDVAAEAMRRQAAGIAATQDASGLWWIVLDRPGETYLETSTTALFAYGLARGYRYGLFADDVLPVAARAITAVRTKVVDDEDGEPVVTGISGPTMPGDTAHYASIPIEDDKGYGVGAVILALLETSGLPAPR